MRFARNGWESQDLRSTNRARIRVSSIKVYVKKGETWLSRAKMNAY
jgi:hypothetical protein